MTELAPDFQDYLQHARVQQRLSPRTLRLYTDGLLRLQVMLAEAALPARSLTLAQARRLAALLHREGLAPKSIALLLSVWRSAYRWLGLQGRVALNPFDGLRAPRRPSRCPRPWVWTTPCNWPPSRRMTCPTRDSKPVTVRWWSCFMAAACARLS